MAVNYTTIRIDGRKISYGLASPALDAIPKTAAVDDIRINMDRTSFIAFWRCTVAGKPGTWVAVYGAPSPPVLSVSAGPGISITGTSANPVVNNTGVLSVSAGTGTSVTGTAANPVVNNTGVLSVSAGTNVTVTGTAANPVINSTAAGVTAVTASPPISSSGGPTPNITHDASTVTPGTYNPAGISVDAYGHITAAVTATVVASVGAGPGISITGTSTNPIVNNTGVLSVSAGTGTSVTGTAANPVVNNTGVLGVSVGFGGLVLGGTAQNPSIANGSASHLCQFGAFFSPVTSFPLNPHWVGDELVTVNYAVRKPVHVPTAVAAYTHFVVIAQVNRNTLDGNFEIHFVVDGVDQGAYSTVTVGAIGTVGTVIYAQNVVNNSMIEMKLVDPATGPDVTSGQCDIRATCWGAP